MPATMDTGEAGPSDRKVLGQPLSLALLEPFVARAAIALLLALLLCIVFWRVTLDRQILSPGDLIFQSFPWLEDQPDGYQGPSNPWQSDDAYLYYPRRHSIYEGDGGGRWWQDDYLTGARNTFSNDFLGIEYYPPGLWYRVLPYPEANTAFTLSILFTAGLGMFALLRQLKFPYVSAAYGGMLFMLNGHFMVWLAAWSLPAMLSLVPLMLFGFEKWKETRHPPWLLVPSACIALQIAIAYIPALVVTAVILLFYGLARLAPLAAARLRRDVTVHAGAYIAAGLAGFALGAYSLIPSLSSALGSSYQQDRALGLGHVPLENAWAFMFPDFFGGPRNWFGFGGNYPEWIAYVGISAVPLIIPGVWHLRKSWLGWFAMALIVFSAAQVYGIPPLKEVAHITGLKQVAATRWYFGMNLGAAIFAPAGLTALLDGKRSLSERRQMALAVAMLTAFALVAVTVLYFDRSDTMNWTWVTEGKAFIPPPWDAFNEIKSASTHFHRQIAAFIVCCALVVAGLLWPSRARLAVTALFVITFTDLFAFGQHYNGTVARANLYPESPGINFLQEDDSLFRIAPVWSDGTTMVLPGYTANLYGLSTITGYDHYRDPDYTDFLGPIRSENDRQISELYGYVTVGTNRVPLNENVLRLLNVKYVVAPPDGLFSSDYGQTLNTQAFPVFEGRSQGQVISLPEGSSGVEFLLATGGGPAPDAPITIAAWESPAADAEPIGTMTLDGADVRDNHWYQMELPPQTQGTAYFEVTSPATKEHPYFVWGALSTNEEQRYDNREPADGSLTFRALREPGDWLTPSYLGDDLSIYELTDPLPRAWGVSQAETRNHDDAITAVAEATFDPDREVILEGPSQDAGSGTVHVEMTSYEPGEIRARASGEGWVIFSERYDGGWNATVDGSDAEILRANGILMAVKVGPGEHDVRLSFEPPEYVWGRRISIITATLLVLALAAYTARAFLRRRGTED